ncbi:MAG: GNAT family N-acetyltransferase [Bacteroidota bacterium]
MTFNIREATIQEVFEFSHQVFDPPQPIAAYHDRLSNVPHLLLIAETSEGKAVGFKVGYEREGYWYSWFGGVHPEHRRTGIASALADAQDTWAKSKGYPHVSCKTRNNRREMLAWCIKRGFRIIEVGPREDVDEYRIHLRKFY